MKITLITAEDWQGVYINGKLAYENHSINAREFINLMNNSGVKNLETEFETKSADDDWLYNEGRLPKSLDEVKLADFES